VNYDKFIAAKAITSPLAGLTDIPPLSAHLFSFQADIVRWALKRGRAAIFADCGMGKTPMQLEWAKHIPGNVLILAPLAVASQTVHEGARAAVQAIEKRQRNVASGDTRLPRDDAQAGREPRARDAYRD
jgi:superfamily II DNA or RNA helicase